MSGGLFYSEKVTDMYCFGMTVGGGGTIFFSSSNTLYVRGNAGKQTKMKTPISGLDIDDTDNYRFLNTLQAEQQSVVTAKVESESSNLLTQVDEVKMMVGSLSVS